MADTRTRLVRAAEQLFRTQGYAATGLKELTAAAAAPWGSLYHFFPGGKAQLGAAAARYAGEFYAEGWRRAFEHTRTPGEAMERIFVGEARILEGGDYHNGCPVAAVTLDVASTDDDLRAACDAAFEAWLAVMADGFERRGAPAQDARALALFALAAIEGAIVLSRAARSPEAVVACAGFVRQAVDRAAQSWRP
jgi:AcrR family transcriptional regulator